MKKQFNNIGVAQVQADIISLPREQRLVEAEAIRTDFVSWMADKFELQPDQYRQLENLSDELYGALSLGIASRFERGMAVQFFKEEKDDDPISIKDIILNDSHSIPQGEETHGDYPGHFYIWIRYRKG